MDNKVLFITIDGIPIKEGDKFWYVLKKDFQIDMAIATTSDKYFTDDVLLYGNENRAIQFAWDNKPIWSRKDFRELIKSFEERIAPPTDKLHFKAE